MRFGLLALLVGCGSPAPEAPTPLEQARKTATMAAEGVYPMVQVKAGTYEIGDPEAETEEERKWSGVHPVVVTRSFEIGTHEVTQKLWHDTTGSYSRTFHAEFCGEYCPVAGVSWFEAVEFANKLSHSQMLTPCYEIEGDLVTVKDVDGAMKVTWPKGLDCTGYRLPTDAEWEIAARAGGDFKYAGSDDRSEVAWIDTRLNPVGTKAANAWGLYDMSGNIYEWCWDWMTPYPTTEAVDPIGADGRVEERWRVARGGSYKMGDGTIRSRQSAYPSNQSPFMGLRLARTR